MHISIKISFNHPMVKVKGLSLAHIPEQLTGFNHPMVKVKVSVGK